jgi:hypothetical protein
VEINSYIVIEKMKNLAKELMSLQRTVRTRTSENYVEE